MQGKIKIGYTLTVRDAVAADTGKRLYVGDVVYGALTNGRIYFSRIYRAGGTVEEQPGNAAAVNPTNTSEAYMTLANVAEPETPTVTLKHTIEVYSDGSLRVDGNPYP